MSQPIVAGGDPAKILGTADRALDVVAAKGMTALGGGLFGTTGTLPMICSSMKRMRFTFCYPQPTRTNSHLDKTWGQGHGLGRRDMSEPIQLRDGILSRTFIHELDWGC